MFEFISGNIIEKTPTYAVLENNGIAYLINISLFTYSQIENTDKATLYINQIIKEDSNALFGFYGKSEREIFRLLISVSGIGANTARIMLSSLSPDEIKKAIQTDNVNLIKSVKGIGVKTAQRVIIDLRDKIEKAQTDGNTFVSIDNSKKEEALSALLMLGFAKKPAEKVIENIIKDNTDVNIETIVKLALKAL